MRKITLSLLIITLPCLIFTQVLTQDWQASKRLSANEHLHNAIEGTNGVIVAVGFTESYPGTRRDGFFQLIDNRSGQIIRSKNLGGNQDDELRDVVQTNNGQFILAGTTESDTQGKKDAWLVCIDENGEIIWEERYGSSGDDAFETLVYDPEQQLVTAFGYRNDQKSEDLWGVQLAISPKRANVLNEQLTYGRGDYENVKAAIINPEGKILLTGNHNRPKGHLFLMQVNESGTQEWVRTYGKGEEIVEDLQPSRSGYILAGSTVDRREGENMLAIAVSSYGDQLWSEQFGGEDHDAALSVAEALDGGFYLLGRSLSHAPNARAEKIYLLKISKGGEREFQQYYGGEKDDIGRVVLQLKNGAVFLGADTDSDNAQRTDITYQALRSTLDVMPDLRQMKGSVEFIRIDENVKLNTPGEVLRPEDRSYLSVTIFNESKIALPNVSLRMGNNGVKGIQAWPTNYIGQLQPGERREVNIPVKADANPEPGSHEFPLSVMAGAVTLASTSVKIESKVPEPARLGLFDYKAEVVSTGTRGAGSNAVKLSMTFVNEGDFSTNNAQLQAQIPNGIRALSGPQSLNIGTLPASGKRQISFTFQASPEYLQNRRDATLAFQVLNNGQANGAPIRITIDNLENPNASSGFGDKPVIIWVDPSPGNKGGSRFQTSDPNAKIRVAIASRRRLRTQDIKVYQNKTVVETNKSFAEEELSAPNGNYQEATYSRKIALKEGPNEIFIQIGDGTSKKIVIDYQPRSRNLHVIAIGPSHPDLKYTSKDAQDFAQAFQQQQGKLFNQVFIQQLTSPEVTTQQEIIKAMVDLENKFRNEEILPNDVVIVFISSHGIVGSGERYKIIPSGFDPVYGDRFTIDYKDDILAPLENINCKKMVFIDACHSGAADAKGPFKDQRRSEMIFRLNAQSPGLSSITSCQSSEMSYEDEAWGNGAFTEAILEALQNETVQDSDGTTYKASSDDDFLTIGELYRFVRRRVNGLVRTYKPNAPTAQTPDLIKGTEALDEDLPIFEITRSSNN